ncbi:hypothetical protein DY000_02022652 [Brassica cretica]|uniref:Uncharacterized protein n=1 Tax=Brassica cretica TaxID=69181 RepID=A0ABQ7EK71_BRACR|nr:hypothetical protein DY000_02022652 [Brassica cretica]
MGMILETRYRDPQRRPQLCRSLRTNPLRRGSTPFETSQPNNTSGGWSEKGGEKIKATDGLKRSPPRLRSREEKHEPLLPIRYDESEIQSRRDKKEATP